MKSLDQARCVAFIFARGGSKGLPGKNIKTLAGKPLIAWAIETARACQRLETVIVSTDDPQIAAVALEYGAEVPFMRPDELAADAAPEWKAWQHAIQWFQNQRGDFDLFVSLPPTSPFRSPEDVDACLDELIDHPLADMVITIRAAERSPYFNMVSHDNEGFAHLVITPETSIARRQEVPQVFDVTTVAYVARPEFVLMSAGIFNGRVRTVEVPAARALDIDTPYDFMLAECIARNGDQNTCGR